MTEFISFLEPHIRDFIKYRQASEHWNESSYEVNLKLFDRFCHEYDTHAISLTQEMADSWCKQRSGEMNNSCRSRIYVVVSFIKFLQDRELTSIQLPVLPRKENRTYIPHAFTKAELTNFFNECDTIPLRGNNNIIVRKRKMMIPVFFRLLYSSGIRTTEARLLRRSDVDLDRGIIDIRYSKGHNQHFIVLHDSMLEVMKIFDEAISTIHPNRNYFFPSKEDAPFTKNWITKNFRMLWDKVNIAHATAYELRHHYAILNINRWIDQGFDFDDKMLYLCKSMGHTTIESTKYYYSIVSRLATILEEQTADGLDWIIPEVSNYEESF